MADNELTRILKKGSEEIGVIPDDAQIESLNRFADALREKNKVMNLTGITDDEGIAMRHFVDSLTIVPYIRSEQERAGKESLSLIDIGTGAGFPGIPVKIMMSPLDITLADSLQKRLGFLDEVIEDLQLQKIKTLHTRAEDAGRDKRYRERYDIAVARAVADLPVLCEYCLPFVKTGGVFLAMKGKSEDETKRAAKAVATLGGNIEKYDSFCLPGTDMERSVIVIRKVRHTPSGYPRAAGKPSKSPIC